MSDVQRSWATTLETVNMAQMQDTDFLNKPQIKAIKYISEPVSHKFQILPFSSPSTHPSE